MGMQHIQRYRFALKSATFDWSIMYCSLIWLAGLGCFIENLPAQETVKTSGFVICYHPNISSREFAPYDVVVVDYAYPPKSIKKLRQQGKLVFGYLSLGKIHKERPFLPAVQSARIGLQQDVQWKDSFRVDAADQKWHRLVLESIIPEMKTIGFSGVFLDDLDDLKIRNLQDQGISLIRQIRESTPEFKLMANRGLEYADRFSPFVDYLLLESCFLQSGSKRDSSDSDWALKLFLSAKKENPKLKGVALDYISETKIPLTTDQKRIVLETSSLHKQHGLLSCVSFRDLQSVPSIIGK